MTLLQIAFFALTVFALTGCNQKSGNNKIKTEDCDAYFQYDALDHYFLDIDDNNVWSIDEKKNKTEQETKLLELLIGDSPVNLSKATGFDRIGFIKKQVQTKKFEELNTIFCKKKHKEVSVTKCLPVYRDILVFKRNKQVIGTAKICFDCDKGIINGTKQNTEEFGQSGDYGKLYKLLH